MEFFRKKVIILIAIFIIIAVPIIINIYKEHKHMDYLNNQSYYLLYNSFVYMEDKYEAFYMLNFTEGNIDEIIQYVKPIIDDDFIKSFRSDVVYQKYGEHPIVLHIIIPCDELPYGWEKSELDISCNFDRSTFYRNTKVRITIPVNGENFSDCTIYY